jgi:hypothetical protein
MKIFYYASMDDYEEAPTYEDWASWNYFFLIGAKWPEVGYDGVRMSPDIGEYDYTYVDVQDMLKPFDLKLTDKMKRAFIKGCFMI